MLNLKDFKVGETAYMLMWNKGRLVPPEIREVTVVKVGRKYVTVKWNAYQRRFERIGDTYGLLEDSYTFGGKGELYN